MHSKSRSSRRAHGLGFSSLPTALLLVALPALVPATALGQGTTVMHCNVVGIGGDNANFRGIRFQVDQDFTAVEVHINGSSAGAFSFDVELRRSTGYVDPVIATASVAANLPGAAGVTPYPAVLIDFAQTIVVSGTETFTLKALNIVGAGAMYWEVAGIGNIPCPDAEVTNENNTATPTMRTSACGFRVIDSSGPTIIGTNYCISNANSTGQIGRIDAYGSPLISANDVTLTATRLPNNSFMHFITSTTSAQINNPGGSLGNLCITGSIGRYIGPGQIQNTGATGSASLVLNLSQIPHPSLGFISATPGPRHFQAWHRDSVSGAAVSNFTDATTVTFL
jgi:hypothetical protein